ncbi:MAG: exodeoxyribonuclease VII large subunit [Desulfobacterales bacterium]|jgi:exodeoxyribonuclease VII large subunit
MQTTDTGGRKNVYTVSELNASIKDLIENNFPFVWVFGEISNFRVPASGHFYFTLKDAASQISSVMFRGQQRNLKFEPEDGLNVTGMGRISVYEPRGTYQIILEYLEPSGAGALQIAFEKLKARLLAEGLFDEVHKKSLPFLPYKISIITSPTGAVVHDILHIINRRFPNIAIRIIPINVQGDGSVEQIVDALEWLNTAKDADVAIIARGGGSLEDLQAFNSEPVARAIFASEIPIISAIGHETDYTISDFVADLRAPTPSAAAELVIPEKSKLDQRRRDLLEILKIIIYNYIKGLKQKLNVQAKHLVDPRRKLEDVCLKVDDLTMRLNRTLRHRILRERQHLEFWDDRLSANNPVYAFNELKLKLDKNYYSLYKILKIYIKLNQMKLRAQVAKLQTLNPVAILARGYSITRTIPAKTVVKDPEKVSLNQDLEIMVALGRLYCRVKGKSKDG